MDYIDIYKKRLYRFKADCREWTVLPLEENMSGKIFCYF